MSCLPAKNQKRYGSFSSNREKRQKGKTEGNGKGRISAPSICLSDVLKIRFIWISDFSAPRSRSLQNFFDSGGEPPAKTYGPRHPGGILLYIQHPVQPVTVGKLFCLGVREVIELFSEYNPEECCLAVSDIRSS